jgi:hypothetical protein
VSRWPPMATQEPLEGAPVAVGYPGMLPATRLAGWLTVESAFLAAARGPGARGRRDPGGVVPLASPPLVDPSLGVIGMDSVSVKSIMVSCPFAAPFVL